MGLAIGLPHDAGDGVSAEIRCGVRMARKAANVTQVALAMHLRVSVQQLLKYEVGVNRLSVRALLEITRFLKPSIRRRIDNLMDALIESDGRPHRCANTRF